MRRPSLPLVPLVLTLASLAVPAVEIPVTTPFAVRKEAGELLDDLGRGGEPAAVIQRIRDLLERQGGALFQPRGSAEARPLGEILTERLAAAGLAGRYAEVWKEQAADRLAQARRDDELTVIARTYPGTAAAATARRLLADRAWDAGRLGSFRALARQAGDDQDPPRRARLEAAERLLTAPSPGAISPLADAPEIWRLAIEQKAAGTARLRRIVIGNQAVPAPPAVPALSAPLADAVALSDGRTLTIIDHLVGNQVAAPLTVGNQPLARRQAVPACAGSLFVAAGIQDQQRIVLVAADAQGHQRWRTVTPTLGYNPILAAPVVLDRQVVLGAIIQDGDGASLRVLAFDLATGMQAWEVTVARLGSPRAWMFAVDAQTPLMPVLAATADGLLVLSNGGIIARLDSAGNVARVWSYRGSDPAAATLEAPGGQVRRLGSLLYEGGRAVACPVDLPGTVLVLDGDGAPQTYAGDGADGDVLAMRSGMALLSGGKLVALDLAQRTPRWIGTGAGHADAQAVIGDDVVLVSGKEALLTLDRATGLVRSSRRLEQSVAMTASSEILVLATGSEQGAATVVGHGATLAVTTRLQAAAAADPRDYRSVASLASLAAASGDPTKALDLYQTALDRGAPAEHAARAMALLRRRLDRADPAPEDLARLAKLVQALPELAGEAGWWQGRAAERRGDPATAAKAYRASLTMPDTAIALVPGLEVSLHHLADRALLRLAAAVLPPSPVPPGPATAAAPPMTAWVQNSRRARETLVSGGLAVGYADGVLVANRLSDGQEAWWRRPDRPLLGVQSRPDAVGDGIPLTVVPGTSAATAGLQSGDMLLRLNDRPMRSFSGDLVPTVVGLGVRGRFSAVVRRGENLVTCTGALGGELVDPFAANDQTVLIWPISPSALGAGALNRAAPEGLWVAALDLASGKELWRATVPPSTIDSRPARPLLTDNDLVILGDGPDLVARPAHAGPGEQWRLPGLATSLEDAQILPGGHLWLPGSDRSRLVRLSDGKVLALVATDPQAQVLLSGDDLLVRSGSGEATAWDLAWGVDRWHTAGCNRLVSAAGDAVWILTANNALQILDRASGQPRRLYGEWTSVGECAVAGDRLEILGSTPTGPQIAAISRRGGALLWRQSLPAGYQASDLRLLANGDAALTLSSGPDSCDLLVLDAGGRVVQAHTLGGDANGRRLVATPDGALDCSDHGLVAIPRLALPAVPPMPLGSDQVAGGVRWKLSRAEGGLELRVNFAPGSESVLEFRLGTAGEAIDSVGWRVLVQANGTTTDNAGPQGWRLGSVTRDGTEVVARLQAPIGTLGRAQALVVRAVDRTALQSTWPAWLSALWRPVTGGP